MKSEIIAASGAGQGTVRNNRLEAVLANQTKMEEEITMNGSTMSSMQGWVRMAIASALVCLCGSAVDAQVLIRHLDDNDPTSVTEGINGWSLSTIGAGGSSAAVNDSGTPAWQITANAGGVYRYRETELTQAQEINLTDNGFRLGARFRVVTPHATQYDQEWSADLDLNGGVNSRIFLFRVDLDGNGDPVITAPHGGLSKTMLGAGSGYHTYTYEFAGMNNGGYGIMTMDNQFVFAFDGLFNPGGGGLGGLHYQFDPNSGVTVNWNDGLLALPEPGVWALGSLAGLFLLRRSRRA